MLLTIAIPVYNGAKYIDRTIESVLAANFDFSNVELIVSDNCSDDGTTEILKKYKSITVFEHNENIGFDRNVDRLFKYARGKYVWTLGADDILINKDLGELISILKEQTLYSVIFAGQPEKVSFKSLSGEELLYNSHFRVGFISNNIINKKLWLESDANEFFGSGWVHYGMVLKMLKRAPARMLSKIQVEEIEETKHNKSWVNGGKGLLIGLNLVEIFDKMHLWGYSIQMKRRCKMVIKDAYPKMVIYSKCTGLKVDIALVKRFINAYKEFPSFWLLDLPILMLPGILFTIPFYFYKKLKFNA